MTRCLREASEILHALGFPAKQRNERSSLCLLALVDLRPGRAWSKAANPLIGITPIMSWLREHYHKKYAPNTRETVRRETMHQFVAAGLAALNPDAPKRAVNSPRSVYQIPPEAHALVRSFGTRAWTANLAAYLSNHGSLIKRYALERSMNQVAATLTDGKILELTPGEHSDLIKKIVEEFSPRFAPGAKVVYVGDTGDKFAHHDEPAFVALGLSLDPHGKMPDVVLHDVRRNWLLLVESVTSHGPVDGKRHSELAALFGTSAAPLVYVTAFPTRQTMARFLAGIAWETEVWIAEAPDHLIHFNGARYLGPYP